MAYDEQLANRIRQAFGARSDITERKMFGGLTFLCRGRICCGIVGNDLMARIPADEFDAVMRGRHVRPMDFTGKPLKRFVYVSPPGFRTAATLRAWLARGERVAEEKATGPTKRRPNRKTASSAGDRRAISSVAGRAEIRPGEIRPRRSVSRRSGNPVQ
jgi:TfoX N-terminal domain